jgi:phosphoribosylformylglycinamidine cyclo-ligase
MNLMNDNYEKRGVSYSKTEVHKAIASIDKGIEPTAFCKIVSDPSDDQFGIILHADGAGTKSSLAWAYWKETGDLSVWKGIAQDALIMNIDDMICTGAEGGFVISSTIGRNKSLVPGEVISSIINGTEEVIAMLNNNSISACSAGGETADIGDLVRTVIVDSTVFARIEKKDIIACKNISPGDVIVGLASFGQAVYEDSYNSGIGSNGLTSARHDLFNTLMKEKYPQTFDSSIDPGVTYIGKYFLTDPSPVEGMDMGRFVLSPTRTYSPVLKRVFSEYRGQIHGIIHCTGGGQAKVMNFVSGLKIIKDNLFPVPSLFEMIQASAGTEWKEMYSVFNMGHRMEIYLPAQYAQGVIDISRSFGIEARIIGRCEPAESKSLVIETDRGRFVW